MIIGWIGLAILTLYILFLVWLIAGWVYDWLGGRNKQPNVTARYLKKTGKDRL